MNPLLRIVAILFACAVFMPMLGSAAAAHRLVLFVRVEEGTLKGYGFFVGGGRPHEATLTIRNAAGVELFRGPIASDASFSFRPAVPAELHVVMDAGDGHVAQTQVAAERFGPSVALPPIAAAQAAQRESGSTRDEMRAEGSAASATASVQDLASLVDRSVDRAVSRQIAPLLEAYAQAETRIRFNEVVSGIAVIIGLAGLLLWGLSRRRRDEEPRLSSSRDEP